MPRGKYLCNKCQRDDSVTAFYPYLKSVCMDCKREESRNKKNNTFERTDKSDNKNTSPKIIMPDFEEIAKQQRAKLNFLPPMKFNEEPTEVYIDEPSNLPPKTSDNKDNDKKINYSIHNFINYTPAIYKKLTMPIDISELSEINEKISIKDKFFDTQRQFDKINFDNKGINSNIYYLRDRVAEFEKLENENKNKLYDMMNKKFGEMKSDFDKMSLDYEQKIINQNNAIKNLEETINIKHRITLTELNDYWTEKLNEKDKIINELKSKFNINL